MLSRVQWRSDHPRPPADDKNSEGADYGKHQRARFRDDAKYLHAGISELYHVDSVAIIYGDSPRAHKFTVSGPCTTKRELKVAAAIEYLHAVVSSIGHVDIAAAVNGDIPREVKFTLASPKATKLELKVAAAVEYLHAVISWVCHVEIIVSVKGEPLREV